MLLILILAMAGPFILKGPDGHPLMNVKDLSAQMAVVRNGARQYWEWFRGKAGQTIQRGKPAGAQQRIYKWKDAGGEWHYSDKINPEGSSQEIHINPDVNVLAPVPIRSDEHVNQPAQVSRPAHENRSYPGFPLSVSPGEAARLINDAKGIQGMMDERSKQIR